MRSCLIVRMLVAGTVAVASAACLETPASPRPIFTNMVGTWQGTVSANLSIGGATHHHTVCDMTLVVSTQSGGHFSGTYQLAGPCSGSGAVSGEMAASTELITFDFDLPAGGIPCTFAGATAWLGMLAGATLNAQRTEAWACDGPLGLRHIVLAVTAVPRSAT
jgi:hypothetical protein